MNDKIQADRNRLKGLLSEKAIRIYDISQVHSFDQLPVSTSVERITFRYHTH